MSEGNFLVVYESDDEDPDELILDVDVHDPVFDVVADLGTQVTNRTSTLATTGLGLAILGALWLIASTIVFIIYYPDAWHVNGTVDDATVLFVVALTGVGLLLLLLGNLFVGLGRSIHAKGYLRALRLVPNVRE